MSSVNSSPRNGDQTPYSCTGCEEVAGRKNAKYERADTESKRTVNVAKNVNVTALVKPETFSN